MLSNDEFLCGSGAACASPAGMPRWARPAAQWLGVGLAHVVVIGLVLQMSPPARQMLDEVIQASLITPQTLPVAKPAEALKRPKPPKKHPPPQPTPVFAAASSAVASPASFLVAETSAEPAPASPAVAAPVAAPPPALVPPVFDADYLENPSPQYPSMSRRLGEKGRVLLRIFISAAGRAERVELRASSGFARLASPPHKAVAGWRFVPARRGDEAVAAWVLVPVSFVM